MGWLVGRIMNYSIGDVLRLAAKPHMLPAVLSAPPVLPRTDTLLSLFPDLTREQALTYQLEYLNNMQFYAAINAKTIEKRMRRPVSGVFHAFLYTIVRHMKPDVIVETGVFDGETSAALLQALHDNAQGTLVSIDLPAYQPVDYATARMEEPCLPPGCEPGWAIPDYLRDRLQLVLGDSKVHLPLVLQEYDSIDIFIHDSLHTYEHMTFEYTVAWPKIRPGGLLMSDDIFTNRAFTRFVRAQNRRYLNAKNFGLVRK